MREDAQTSCLRRARRGDPARARVCVCVSRSAQNKRIISYRLSCHAATRPESALKSQKIGVEGGGLGRRRWRGVSASPPDSGGGIVSLLSPRLLSLCVADWRRGEAAWMWTPTDHWLEITIETLGRWGARCALAPLSIFDIFSMFVSHIFKVERGGVVLVGGVHLLLLIRTGVNLSN